MIILTRSNQRKKILKLGNDDTRCIVIQHQDSSGYQDVKFQKNPFFRVLKQFFTSVTTAGTDSDFYE
jgi:hypothetical protein